MHKQVLTVLAVPALLGALLVPVSTAHADDLNTVTETTQPTPQVTEPAAQARDVEATTDVAAKKPKRPYKGPKANLKWKVPTGPRFNNPMIDKDRFVIERQILRAIRNTPRGERITISAYSLDRGKFATELIQAYRRGVKVQVLLNDHLVPGAQVDIQRVIGSDTKKANFLKRCVSGCRADQNEYNNLHSKFYLFSRTGRSRNVVMLGSHNMTLNAVRWQWNDLWTAVEEPVLYKEFRTLFNDMRKDYSERRPSYTFCDTEGRQCPNGDQERYFTTVFPRFTTSKRDQIMDILNNVQCVYTDAAGAKRRTKLRLSMHTMRGNRGTYLAQRLRGLYAAGCDLKVNYGIIGYNTKVALGGTTARGRVPLRSTGFDFDDDATTIERYTHHKYFVLSGSYKGNIESNMVWTGSTNWSSLGTPQDEILFSMHGRKVVKKYLENFRLMWKKPFSRDAYTTTYSSWRTADGRVVRVPTVTVEPDGVVPGSTWEND